MTTPITVEMTEHEITTLLRYVGGLRLMDMYSKPDVVALDSIHRDLLREYEKYKEQQ